MINYNSKLLSSEAQIIDHNNRGLKYGDGVFETLKIVDSKIIFLEDHYFRLMASMRILRMEIPANFTLDFIESEIHKTVAASKFNNTARIRITVFRKSGGLYTPKTNEIDYIIEVDKLNQEVKSFYELELFKDFYINSSFLSTIKTTNKILNVVASIFAKENDYDNCLLINEKKNLVEVTNGNIFLVFGNKLVTPSINDGCIKGIVRKKLVELVSKSSDYLIEERSISPFEIQKADELFITNSIVDIQPVHKYRKKEFSTQVSDELRKLLIKSYS